MRKLTENPYVFMLVFWGILGAILFGIYSLLGLVGLGIMFLLLAVAFAFLAIEIGVLIFAGISFTLGVIILTAAFVG
jgi:hypothetical protein